MKKIKYTILTAFAAIMLSLFTGVSNVFAKQVIMLSPTSQRVVLIPGETYRGSIRVTNPYDAGEDLNYVVSLGSFSVSQGNGSLDDYGDADIETISDRNAIVNWITLDRDSGTLAPNEEGTIAFSIDVPDDAPAGGQYATILVRNDVQNNTSEGTMGIVENIQMASTIYAEVAGETNKVGKIQENNIPSFLFNNTLEATSLVRNEGNVHTDAEYTLQVWSIFSDEEICTNEEDPETALVLPDTERYHTQTCNLPSIGIFKAKQTVTIFGEVSTLEKTVLICPLWLLFVVVLAIVAIIIYFVVRAKGRKK